MVNNDGLIWNPEEAKELIGKNVYFKDGVNEDWDGPGRLRGLSTSERYVFMVGDSNFVFIKSCTTTMMPKLEAEEILNRLLGTEVTIRDEA